MFLQLLRFVKKCFKIILNYHHTAEILNLNLKLTEMNRVCICLSSENTISIGDLPSIHVKN